MVVTALGQCSDRENIQLGMVAAWIEGVLLQPTLFWKNARAQNLPVTLHPGVIYRGTGAAVLNECGQMGLHFGVTGYFQQYFQQQQQQGTTTATAAATTTTQMTRAQEVGSAMLGGAGTAILATPVECVMIQQQRFGGSFLRTVQRITTEFGLLSSSGGILRRGVAAAMLRDGIYVSGLLGVTPIVHTWLLTQYSREHVSSFQAGVLAAALGGLFGAVPSHPLDVIKTCMQGDLEQKLYTDYRTTYHVLMNSHHTRGRRDGGGHSITSNRQYYNYYSRGLTRLFQGCLWRTLNIVATVFIANECRVRLAPVMFPHHSNTSSSIHQHNNSRV